MNNKIISDILDKLLNKDYLEDYKKKALKGDSAAQYILGEIYYYGIDTNDEYWKDVEKTLALTRYSKRRNKYTFGFTCYCNKKPDYEEALKWYEMAAVSGNVEAKKQVEKILNGVQEMRRDTIIQLFKKGM